MKLARIVLLSICLSGSGMSVFAGSERYIDSDFHGQAKEFIRKNEKPVTSDFKNFARKFLEEQARGGDCEEYKEATHLYMVDLFSDGKIRGLIAYTLEGCGHGENAERTIQVFTNINGKWTETGHIIIGDKFYGWGNVVEIKGNKIKTGNNDRGKELDHTYTFENGVLRQSSSNPLLNRMYANNGARRLAAR